MIILFVQQTTLPGSAKETFQEPADSEIKYCSPGKPGEASIQSTSLYVSRQLSHPGACKKKDQRYHILVSTGVVFSFLTVVFALSIDVVYAKAVFQQHKTSNETLKSKPFLHEYLDLPT